MFDIFCNRKKDEVLQYIDTEIKVHVNVMNNNFKYVEQIEGRDPDSLNEKEMIFEQNRAICQVLEELQRIKKAIERIYNN